MNLAQNAGVTMNLAQNARRPDNAKRPRARTEVLGPGAACGG